MNPEESKYTKVREKEFLSRFLSPNETPWLIELNVNPDWEKIRDDPRFGELVKKMNL